MSSASPWLVEVAAADQTAGQTTGQTDGQDVFYAVPHAGGGVAAVRDLCRLVGPFAASAAVRLPAREARLDEPPLHDVLQIAQLGAEAIADHADGRPITLYGHCSGAIIAFEVARRLQPRNLRALFISGHGAPDRIPVTNVWSWPTRAFIQRVAQDGFLPGFIAEDEELLELILPALRADYEAVETYRPQDGARIDVEITGILGEGETGVSRDDLAAWSRFTSAGLRMHFMPGGHNLLLDHAADVAEVIISGSRWRTSLEHSNA
jgi:surfactin synthase thioesterase subunit